jgi:hypothetical protein
MKYWKYQFANGEENLVTKMIPATAENEEIAKREAYNGAYEIVDDGEPDPEEQPTQLDRVEAQITYTAMMTDTLLEG